MEGETGQETDAQQGRSFSAMHDFQEITNKLTKLLKIQADGLTPPTFSQPIINQISKILLKAKTASNQNKNAKKQDYINSVTQFFPKIVELSSHNFLQRTIRDFQSLISTIIKEMKKFSEEIQPQTENHAHVVKVLSTLTALMPKVLLISFNKASPSVFSFIQQSVHSIQCDLISIRESDLTTGNDNFNIALQYSAEAEAMIRHIIAAHSFISVAESLQNTLRHFSFDGSINIFPLPNSQFKLRPSKPKIDTEKYNNIPQTSALLEAFSCEDPKNTAAKQQFITDFDAALQTELRFTSCTPAVEELVNVILKIQPPPDTTKKVFAKCCAFFFAASRALTQLYKLPPSIATNADIAPFLKSLDDLTITSEAILKAHKKPVGWSADDTKEFMKSIQPMTQLSKVLTKAVDLVSKGNSAVGKSVFRADISSLLPRSVSPRFTIATPIENPRIKRFNILRGLALVGERLAALEESGIVMRPSGSIEMHPPSLAPVIARIRSKMEQIECELFNLSVTHFNDFPVAKTGVTMVSSLAELSRRLESLILCLQTTPLEIAGLRELSMILYEQEFNVELDHIFNEINKDLNIFFEVYQVYEILESVGVVSLANASHLTFLVTQTEALAKQWPEFKEASEYFKGVDLFNVDSLEVARYIESFRAIGTRALMTWSCADLISRFSMQTKPVYSCASVVKKKADEPLLLKLLAQLTSWLQNLPRTQPKQNNLREMHVRMTILKQRLSAYVDMKPDQAMANAAKQILDVIDLFAQLRDLFSLKTRLKTLLSFVERVSGSPTSQTEEQESDEEVLAATPTSSEEIKDSEEDKPLPPFHMTKEELALWQPFADRAIGGKQVSVHPEFPSYTEELLHARARAVLDNFRTVWTNDPLFEADLKEIEEAINHKIYDTHTPTFSQFSDKVRIALEQLIDRLQQMLVEFNPPSRGRGYPREFPPHPRSAQIGEAQKELTMIAANIRNPDFGWLMQLIQVDSMFNRIFRSIDISSEKTHPGLFTHSIVNKAIAFFRLDRCLAFAKGSTPDFEPDMAILKALVSGLLERTRFVRENYPLLRHEIDQVIKSSSVNFSVLISSFKVLRRSRSIFDVKEIVTAADSEFFAFGEFFRNLPPDFGNFASFLESSLYAAYTAHRPLVASFVKSDFDEEIIANILRDRHKFKADIENAQISANWEKCDESMSTLIVLKMLANISKEFDQVCPLVMKQRDDAIPGTAFLKLELLIYELQNEVEQLVAAEPSQLCTLYIDTTRVLSALRAVPAKFGFRKAGSATISALFESWSHFIQGLGKFPMNDFKASFKHYSDKIIDALQEGISPQGQREVKSLIFLVKQFSMNVTKELLMKIRFAFTFYEAQVHRFSPSAANADLPFFPLQRAVSAMLSIHTICELIPLISAQLQEITGQMVAGFSPVMDEDSEDVSAPPEIHAQLLPEQLSLYDQTSLAHMTAALLDANIADEERIVGLKLLQRSVAIEAEKVERARARNDSLAKINDYLREFLQKQQPEKDEGAEDEAPGDSLASKRAEQRLANARREFESAIAQNGSLITMSGNLRKSVLSMQAKKARSDHASTAYGFVKRINAMSHFDEKISNFSATYFDK